MVSEAAAAAATASTPPQDGQHFVQTTLAKLDVVDMGYTTLETRVAKLVERDVTNPSDAIALYHQVQALEVNNQGITLDSTSTLVDEKIKTWVVRKGGTQGGTQRRNTTHT